MIKLLKTSIITIAVAMILLGVICLISPSFYMDLIMRLPTNIAARILTDSYARGIETYWYLIGIGALMFWLQTYIKED